MINWTCPGDIFSKCNGNPEWVTEPKQYAQIDGQLGPFIGGVCKLEPRTCGRVLKFSEVVKLDPKLSGNSLVEKVIPLDGKKEDTGEKNPVKKSAKVKKLEQELAQRNMF